MGWALILFLYVDMGVGATSVDMRTEAVCRSVLFKIKKERRNVYGICVDKWGG